MDGEVVGEIVEEAGPILAFDRVTSSRQLRNSNSKKPSNTTRAAKIYPEEDRAGGLGVTLTGLGSVRSDPAGVCDVFIERLRITSLIS